MLSRTWLVVLVAALLMISTSRAAVASDPFNKVADTTNQRIVKLFGSGGFGKLKNYGSGILISPEGHILTVANQMLDTSELVVHLYDGRRMKAVVLATESELDVALVKIKIEGKKIDEPTGLDLPFFDINEAAKRPLATTGDWVLAFGNEFEIAMRDEPVSIQRGIIAAYSKLHGRLGIFDFPYNGEVYVIDAITNNPGAGGGALTDRNGKLLAIVGRELRNAQTETWMNYAVPIGAKVEIKDGEKSTVVSIPEFVAKAMKGQYKSTRRVQQQTGPGGYHGIVFVPNILDRTPPYIEELLPDSPAVKSGLKPNDLVSFVDGEPTVSIKMFQDMMKKTRPGTTIRIEVRRGDSLQTIELKLEEYPKTATTPNKK